jgi:hypothetical protein
MAGDSSSRNFSYFPRKQHRSQNEPLFPSFNDRRRQQRDQDGEEYSFGTENILRKYYSLDFDLFILDEEMEAARRSKSTSRCIVDKGYALIAAGGS